MSASLSLLCVCTGNVCRSPMAEYLLRTRLAGREVRAGSAGIMACPDQPATPEAVQAMAEIDLDISMHRSRPLTDDLCRAASLIVAMTPSHIDAIGRLFPEAAGKAHLVTAFGTTGTAEPISDPIGGSLAVYRRTRDHLESAVSDLILHLREQGRLPGL